MPEPDIKELNESIELLSTYRDRLQKEIVNVAKKLQIPIKKIDSTLKSHSELNEVKQAIIKLAAHRENKLKRTRH